MEAVFDGSFTQQEPIPAAGIERATAIMQSGRLHRYNTAPGEISETVLLELDFRDYTGARYCLAVASGGYAMTTALRAAGLQPGEPVLTNAFTLSPVPGAIAGAGGKPIFVETTDALVIDLADLSKKASSSKVRFLLLSHMRGHIVDMEALTALCDQSGLKLIEDCAHTMGASWNGVKSGRHGLAACYSTQTYKHINSGEGGFLISDDAEFMARATILSGSYMLYGRHEAGPPEAAFSDIRLDTPNCSGRMDNLRAAILRPQLAMLDANCRRWNERYHAIAEALADAPGIVIPQRPAAEGFVASSFQFLAPAFGQPQMLDFLGRCQKRGVELKWFGAEQPVAFTSRYKSWRYAGDQHLPKTDRILDQLCDMRLPLTFSVEDCTLIGTIIGQCAKATAIADQRGELSSRQIGEVS